MRSMNPRRLGIVAFLLGAVCVFGQNRMTPKKFILYPMDKSCVCINALKTTKTASATEVRVGKVAHQVVYQIFWSRTTPRRELFRIVIGGYSNGQGDQLWNYGIASEGDFNGDGLPDYAWYGGDDTGGEMYLFFSSENRYKRVDVLKTVEAAWKQRFKKPAPDLSDSDSGYCVSKVVLERSTTGIVLHAAVPYPASEGQREGTYRFDIAQENFKP